MKRLKQLRALESRVFDNMGQASQLLIDFVQETIQDLDRDYNEQPIERDELGSLRYQIENLVDIYSPVMVFDLDILKRFDIVLSDWYDEVEFNNKALGIPPNKG
jgi:hypothetical protein